MGVYNKDGTDLENVVYSTDNFRLMNAYDVEATALFDNDLITNDDNSTGTSTEYSFTSTETSKNYVLRFVADFINDGYDYQSLCYNYDNGLYYKFEGNDTVKVYNSNMEKTQTISMPSSAGHNNDSLYYNGNIYFPNGNASNLYVWNIEHNTVNSLPITGIVQPSTGSTRQVDAICNMPGLNGDFFLITRDVYTTDLTHQASDKLAIYRYSINSGVAELLGEITWDCVFIQGSAYYNGILYVACNTQTTGSASNYTGITLKVIRTDTWELVDELVASGNFEPEGLDIIPVDNTYEIMMGIARYSEISKAVRYTIPYELE